MISGICKHVLIYFIQRTTLTVEITNDLLNCDKIWQFLYKSVPIFTSFISFQVYFSIFYFNLTFYWFCTFFAPFWRGCHVMTGDFSTSRLSFWAQRRILCILPSSWTNVKDPGNITHPDSSVVSLPLNDKLTQTPHSEYSEESYIPHTLLLTER